MRLIHFFLVTMLFSVLWINTCSASELSAEGGKQKKHFNLPAQTLSESLFRVALAMNAFLVVDYRLLEGVESKGLVGDLTIDEALTQLLEKTRLDYSYDKVSNVVYIREALVEHNAADEMSRREDVSSASEAIPEVLVMGEAQRLRYQTISSSYLHENLSQFKTPRHYSVIPNRLISDSSPGDVFELLRNSSAVAPADGVADSNDDFYIRGFARHAVYLDGLRLDARAGFRLPVAFIKGIEIIKGPTTVRYGQGEPGGVVNLVFDELPKNGGSINIGTDSNDWHRVYARYGKALPRVKFGAMVTMEKFSNARSLLGGQRIAYFPRLSFDLGRDIEFDVSYLGLRSEQSHEQGSVFLAPDGGSLRLIAGNGSPSLYRDGFDSDASLLRAGVDWQVNADSLLQVNYLRFNELRNGVRGTERMILDSPALAGVVDTIPDEEVLTIFDRQFNTTEGALVIDQLGVGQTATINSLFDESSVSNNDMAAVRYDFVKNVFGMDNSLSFGLDYLRQSIRDFVVFEERKDVELVVLNPTGSQSSGDTLNVVINTVNHPSYYYSRYKVLDNSDLGGYIQNSIEVTPSLLISLGSRYSWTSGKLLAENLAVDSLSSFGGLSSQFGVSYEFEPSKTFYVNYSEGMKPSHIVDEQLSASSEPELSEQYEIGLKLNAFQDRLFATASLYRIKKYNVPDVYYSLGERRVYHSSERNVTGLDVDFTMDATEYLSLIGAISLLDIEANGGPYNHLTPPMAASLTASFFGRYERRVGEGTLGLSVGGYRCGDRYSNFENTAVISGHTIFDMALNYQSRVAPVFDVKVGVKNLLNRDYVLSKEGLIRKNMGNGRSIYLSTSIAF